jgi:integrase
MRKLLTPLAVEKLSGGAKRREIADAGMPGLYLVVQPKPSAAKSWAVRYRYGGRTRKLTVGLYPAVDLVKARDRARDALEALDRGLDPAIEKLAAKSRQHAPSADHDAFGVLIRQFFHRHAIPNTRSWRETARLLGLKIDAEQSKPGKPPVFKNVPGRIVARWADRLVPSIRRRDIIELLDESRERGATTTANRELAALSKFFAWCLEREIITTSPAVGIRKPAPERSRDRVLSNEELRVIWRAAELEGYPFGEIVRLLLLTGQRRLEVAGASWPEFDLGARTWIIPRERVKNNRDHLVPLSNAACGILEKMPRFVGGAFLFGLGGRTAFTGYSKGKGRLLKHIAKLNGREDDESDSDVAVDWTLHDIRRTVATRMGELGVLPHVVEAVLNHVSGSKAGVAGTYNRALYEPEKRDALERWATHIDCLTRADAVGERGQTEPEHQ